MTTTRITLDNSNCTRCHNRMLAALHDETGVTSVRSDFSAGCLVIEHHEDLGTLLSVIATTDRAVGVATNGERVMVPVDGHEAPRCGRAGPGGAPAPGTGSSTGAAPRRGTAGARPAGRGRVRAIARQRAAPWLVRRAGRIPTRAFDLVFPVPPVPR